VRSGKRDHLEIIAETHILVDYALEDGPKYKYFSADQKLNIFKLDIISEADLKKKADLSK